MCFGMSRQCMINTVTRAIWFIVTNYQSNIGPQLQRDAFGNPVVAIVDQANMPRPMFSMVHRHKTVNRHHRLDASGTRDTSIIDALVIGCVKGCNTCRALGFRNAYIAKDRRMLSKLHDRIPIGRIPVAVYQKARRRGQDCRAIQQIRNVARNACGTGIPSYVIFEAFLIEPERIEYFGNEVACMVAQQEDRTTTGRAPLLRRGRHELNGLHRRTSRINIAADRTQRSMFQILQKSSELPILEHSLHN